MSASDSPNGPPPLSSSTDGNTTVQPFTASPESKSGWLSTSIATARVIAGTAECLSFPYVQGVFKAVVVLLETVEQMKQNQLRFRELCDTILEITGIIQSQIAFHGDKAASSFKESCERFESILQQVLNAVVGIRAKSGGFRARLKNFLKEFFKSRSIADNIDVYRRKIQGLRENFMFDATLRIGYGMEELLTQLAFAPVLDAVTVPSRINTCPPPSRIFQGRQMILEKMEQFFVGASGQQNTFLLHGLGGAGKTQTALKFIADYSSRFSDMFMVDTSTIETIETGLQNIAAAANKGTTSQDALRWLASKPDAWLLFFDNADDPNINLNSFFPKCNHGNIVITSRNPGLRVYAGSYCLVSDMEEEDAVNLLLRSASEESTEGNLEMASEIVKVLYYLPLAIIQAGAFISKSGDLRNYLKLYAQNRTRLLSERPAQSHDDYAWTVYTTWQISFDQLSEQAAMLLQLCTFLHHQGISEEIFRKASGYKCDPGNNGPSEEELQQPREFLSQFLGPDGDWDSLCFLEITNEIRAYSLMNFDPLNQFSTHPLVQVWARSTVTDEDMYHAHVYAILGMAISEVPESDQELISLRWVPHLDSVLYIKSPSKPDFESQCGTLYHAAHRNNDALRFHLTVLEKRRQTLGVDHPKTLLAMASLASTYSGLGQVKEAEELGVVLLEKCRKILGEDHPNTLRAMAILASTYSCLGQVKEAEELQVVVLEKSRKILGNDHPNTLWAMGNVAATYSALGQVKEAEELEVVVLEKCRKILGDNHPKTLLAMANLAVTYSCLGRAKEAEELKVIVLEKSRKILGNDHPNTLWAMGNVAATYSALGQVKEAEELAVVVLEKRRKILGYDHADTLWAMASLASTYSRSGQVKEAEELGVVLLEKCRKILGEDHPNTLRAMAILASTYSHSGQVKEAEELEVVWLEKSRKILGDDHPDTLLAMTNLAIRYYYQEKFQEAEELEVVVLRKRRDILGEAHPYTVRAVKNLRSTYQALGRSNNVQELDLLMGKSVF